jgi:hypothetical protein
MPLASDVIQDRAHIHVNIRHLGQHLAICSIDETL